MRRLLLVCLLLTLPFQGAWAVAAGIAAFDAPCAASQLAALHGAHGAEAVASADMPEPMVDCDGGLTAEPCCGGSCNGCSHCHGQGLVALVGAPAPVGASRAGGSVLARCARGAPDHVPEHPLRPPLSRCV